MTHVSMVFPYPEQFSVGIIGLGQIGMGYDLNLPSQDHVLTHARAFQQHPRFALLGATDPDEAKRDIFERQYCASAYPSTEALLEAAKLDLLVVSTPTAHHLETVEEILRRQLPKAILCEKPLGTDERSAAAIAQVCREHQVPLFVNYIRRADPGVQQVQRWIAEGEFTPPFKAMVWYSKGLRHSGCHFVDLLSYWFGPIRGVSVLDPGRCLNEEDAEPDLRLELEHGTAYFCAVRDEHFSHHTLEILGANGRLRYERNGAMTWHAASHHPVFPEQRCLEVSPVSLPNDMGRYQMNVAEQVYRALSGVPHALCTVEQASQIQTWITTAIRQSHKRHEIA